MCCCVQRIMSVWTSHHVSLGLPSNPQSSTATFKEQCGLPAVAKLKQCIQSLATRLQCPEGTMGATMVLREGYPCLEPLISLPEATRKVLAAYDTVSMMSPHEPVSSTALKEM